MLPVLAVTDPANATILFDLVNRELVECDDAAKRLRLCDMLIALHSEMTRTDDTNRETP